MHTFYTSIGKDFIINIQYSNDDVFCSQLNKINQIKSIFYPKAVCRTSFILGFKVGQTKF